jgi:SNF2 family DNA or RNA helicase
MMDLRDPKVEMNMARLRKLTGLLKVPMICHLLSDFSKRSLVFSHHKEVIARIEKTLSGKREIFKVIGGQTKKQRSLNLDGFKNSGDDSLMLISTQSGGTGLNLQHCHHGIFCELPWTPALLDQAISRMHRHKQKHPVHIQLAVLDGTIDAPMVRALTRKKNIIRDVIELAPEINNYFKETSK